MIIKERYVMYIIAIKIVMADSIRLISLKCE